MSESNQPYQSPQDNDEVPPCCQNCSSSKRKMGYYITIALGAILYIVAIFNFFSSVFGGDLSYMYAICAALITLLSPLWMNSFSQVLSGLRQSSRKITFISLIIGLIGIVLFNLWNSKFLTLIFIFGTIVSGLWLSLSYYQNGQQSFLQLIKKCFGGNKDNNNLNNINTLN